MTVHSLWDSLITAFQNAHWALHSEGPVATRVDTIFRLLFISTGILAVAVFTLMGFFMIRYHHRRRVVRGNPTSLQGVEGVLVGGLLILLLTLFTLAGKAFYEIYISPTDAYTVYVEAKQWMWKFSSPEGTQGINELHVPANKPIKLLMTSDDVIHSFFVPDFHIKQDIVPGRYMTIWFQAERPGRHRILCTQYCGLDHSKMAGWIVVDPDQGSVPEAALTPPVIRGEQIFTRLQCIACHNQPSPSGVPAPAPDLRNLYGQNVELADGRTILADENYIRDSILDPVRDVVKGYHPVMPSYRNQLTEGEILDLIQYIKNLKETP